MRMDGGAGGAVMVDAPSILFCGENEIKAAVLASIFPTDRFRVSVARSARNVIDELARARPDLLLIDALAPVLDGFALARLLRLRATMPDLPILVLAPEGVALTDLDEDGGSMVHSGPISSSVLRTLVDKLLKAAR